VHQSSRTSGYEGLAFVRDYVFPRSHADLLSVRGPYKKGPRQEATTLLMSDPDELAENVVAQSAMSSRVVFAQRSL
jgi:hypothetical protein